MTYPTIAKPALDQPRSQSAFHTVRLLVGSYVTLSLATLVAAFLMRHDADKVTSAVWVRGTIVAATSLLMLSFVARAARGQNRAYLRLRIVSAVMLTAIVVIIAIPGGFPAWMKVEQGVCGLLLLGVVAIVNGRHLRSLFAE